MRACRPVSRRALVHWKRNEASVESVKRGLRRCEYRASEVSISRTEAPAEVFCFDEGGIGPSAEHSGPRAEQTRPRAEYSGPRAEYSGPRAEYSGPRAEQTGPRAEYSGPRAEQTGPRAEHSGPPSQPRTRETPLFWTFDIPSCPQLWRGGGGWVVIGDVQDPLVRFGLVSDAPT